MSLRVFFRPAALADLDDAAVWYEQQRPGLGSDFLAEVQKVLDTIAAHPDRYPVVSGDIREASVSKFPYCVYYRVKPDRMVIIAVFHTARDPTIWQGRK